MPTTYTAPVHSAPGFSSYLNETQNKTTHNYVPFQTKDTSTFVVSSRNHSPINRIPLPVTNYSNQYPPSYSTQSIPGFNPNQYASKSTSNIKFGHSNLVMERGINQYETSMRAPQQNNPPIHITAPSAILYEHKSSTGHFPLSYQKAELGSNSTFPSSTSANAIITEARHYRNPSIDKQLKGSQPWMKYTPCVTCGRGCECPRSFTKLQPFS